ncbi:MAG: prolyl oligopeptidase family serine peptidase [Planctomycetota bacterium]|jgi:predicted peptidase
METIVIFTSDCTKEMTHNPHPSPIRSTTLCRRHLLLLALTGFSIASNLHSVFGQDETAGTQKDLSKFYEPREFVGKSGKPLKYRLIKPLDYKFGKKYPLVLFLHGAGERGEDNAVTLKHAAKDFAGDALRAKYPAYVLIPQCPTGKKWSDVDWSKDSSELPQDPSDSMQSIKELLDEMVENAGVDKTRIYITGLSMGGYGTWDAIARYPGFFAAAAPICGGGDPKTVDRFKSLPIWCFHGAKDQVVKVNRSREMVDALKQLGSPVKYTEYPEAQHDSWTQTYSNPELYDWMFSQRRESQ